MGEVGTSEELPIPGALRPDLLWPWRLVFTEASLSHARRCARALLFIPSGPPYTHPSG